MSYQIKKHTCVLQEVCEHPSILTTIFRFEEHARLRHEANNSYCHVHPFLVNFHMPLSSRYFLCPSRITVNNLQPISSLM